MFYLWQSITIESTVSMHCINTLLTSTCYNIKQNKTISHNTDCKRDINHRTIHITIYLLEHHWTQVVNAVWANNSFSGSVATWAMEQWIKYQSLKVCDLNGRYFLSHFDASICHLLRYDCPLIFLWYLYCYLGCLMNCQLQDMYC